jgi:hypothetical protein
MYTMPPWHLIKRMQWPSSNICTYHQGPTSLVFGPNLGNGPSKLLLSVTPDAELCVWRIKRCGDDVRLTKVMPFDCVLSKN